MASEAPNNNNNNNKNNKLCITAHYGSIHPFDYHPDCHFPFLWLLIFSLWLVLLGAGGIAPPPPIIL